MKEHRFVVVFRGAGLGGNVKDTDPQATGVPPLEPIAEDAASQKTAEVAQEFLKQARMILKDRRKPTSTPCAGFACRPDMPSYEEVYSLQLPPLPSATRCTKG